MPQTPEAESFLKRILSVPKGPGISLDQVLRPSLDDEAELRRLFATDKTNARLTNPYVGLVDIFDLPGDIRTTRARVVKDEEDLIAKHVMPLSETNRRKEGEPCMVSDLDEFKLNWSIFTENSLSQLFDWNNVVAAGGSVLACLSPLPEESKASKRTIRKHYHSAAYPTSDVDLFLWGLTPEQAEVKINSIYEAVRDSVPWDVTCVRTKHTVSIHSQYPYRSVQIVLRLYSSPAEILAGFDVDAPCCLFNGQRVWANPRAIVAMMRQCNTVDMTRRSPSYEVRLAKYSRRGFEVYVPTLRRNDIDPTIFERSIARIEGLARLLVLERFADADARSNFVESRRNLRGRYNPLNLYARRRSRYKGDLKGNASILGLEMNDYDVGSLHIPYGPGWTARRIDKLIYQTDLGMNSTFNPKNKDRRLHRHPAFFGTMKECLEDCCEHCPQPFAGGELKLQEEEDKHYIRGRITFIKEDPGRQSISGSFKPIDVGEWSHQTYIGATEKFFTAIAAQDRPAVSKMILDGADLNRRDHVGRTPLHVAIISKSVDIACDLIDAGAKMTARLVDGRTSLHLAAQLDQLTVVRKLFEKSAANAEQAKQAEKEAENEDEDTRVYVSDSDSERLSSEDDWSSEEGETEHPKKNVSVTPSDTANAADGIPDDEGSSDILDVNLADWDLAFTPLSYAIVFGSLLVIEELIAAGANVKLNIKANYPNVPSLYPLILTHLVEDEDHACAIAKRLLLAGATSSVVTDRNLCTIFHYAVGCNKSKIVSTLLRFDPNADAVLNFPSMITGFVAFPIVSAIGAGNYSTLAVLLAHGAKISFTEEDVASAQAPQNKLKLFSFHNKSIMRMVHMPVETAIARRDDVVELLVALGADVNLPTRPSLECRHLSDYRRSIVDWVRFAAQTMSKSSEQDSETVVDPKLSTLSGWQGYLAKVQHECSIASKKWLANPKNNFIPSIKIDSVKIKDYFSNVERLLVSRQAKTWDEIYPEEKSTAHKALLDPLPQPMEDKTRYSPMSTIWHRNYITPQLLFPSYDELYEACFTGNNEMVKRLCLPASGNKMHPLQISVQTVYLQWTIGYTPLLAAICGRKWATARLVLAIASSQYCPEKKDSEYTTDDITLDGESDDGSEASYESEGTIHEQDINFVDIANRSSAVKCDISPKAILHDSSFNWVDPAGDKTHKGNLIYKSVVDNDFEAFVNIADLYKTLPEPIELGTELLQQIITFDRSDMLDEYIRRTGLGINIKVSHEEGNEDVSNTKHKLYLGLSVHGKKRFDLAKKNDPNATHHHQENIPLLWKAASVGGLSIVDYLSGDRPLAAYRFYSSSSSDERAEKLRHTVNLDEVLPEWLGWTISPLGESPLTAAIIGKQLDLVKKLFGKAPRLMASALRERVKFLGYNPLMLAADCGCDTAFLDYLLAKGVSPSETDQLRGWNIFHLLCRDNRVTQLDHLLRKLPRDVNEALLVQQSKAALNTPLQIAVQTGRLRVVKSIIDFTKQGLLVSNIRGATPLHTAVTMGYPEITGLLIDVSPPEALYRENGVGDTPLETATLLELHRRTGNALVIGTPSVLNNVHSRGERWADVLRDETEILRLRPTLDDLQREGRLKDGRLSKHLFDFADMMEGKLPAAKAGHKEQPAVEDDEVEKSNPSETLLRVRNGVLARPGLRRLVHLIDVQRCVQGQLPKYGATIQATERNVDGLEPEENDEAQQLRESLVFRSVNTIPERL